MKKKYKKKLKKLKRVTRIDPIITFNLNGNGTIELNHATYYFYKGDEDSSFSKTIKYIIHDYKDGAFNF